MADESAELITSSIEVKKEETKQVFLYDSESGAVHVLDVNTKDSANPEFIPLTITENLGENDILSVKRVASEAYYIPVTKEEEMKKATNYLEKSGIDHKGTPFFVKFVSPVEKVSLEKKGYKVVRPSPVKTP